MANLIKDEFNIYSNTKHGFENFHNQIINMPRPSFSEVPEIIKLMKSLASYIMLIDENVLKNEIKIKDIYRNIFINYKKGIIPSQYRNKQFESRYLDRSETFEYLYGDEGRCGRMMRHYFEFFTFFEYFKIGRNRNYRVIDISAIQELIYSNEQLLIDVLRNRLLNLNIKNNPHIEMMQSIKIDENADYRPARSILRYCKAFSDRRVTDFELAILLGRVDNLQDENKILERAVNIGQLFHTSDRDEQKRFFFQQMGWKNSAGLQFDYVASQEPYFKFKVFLLIMESLDLIKYDWIGTNCTNTIVLTQTAKDLIIDDLPIEIVDLQNLLCRIDNDEEDLSSLSDAIIKSRTAAIDNAIKNNGTLVETLNKWNIRHPVIRNNKRIRSKLIMEVAKIMADYKDETGGQTFTGSSGLGYVEAHHIIEFSTVNGPDITDNLICLNPQNHDLIHHASQKEVMSFYNKCKKINKISFERFKNIAVTYQCLTKEHVKFLVNKGIISNFDASQLDELIDEYGINADFLNSINSYQALDE